MTSLGNSSFYNCKALDGEVNLQYVTSIGTTSFAEDSAITGVTLSYNLTTIGTTAFWNCSSLKGNIEVPKNVETVGYSAFHNTNITSLTFLGDSTKITPGMWMTDSESGRRTLR